MHCFTVILSQLSLGGYKMALLNSYLTDMSGGRLLVCRPTILTVDSIFLSQVFFFFF